MIGASFGAGQVAYSLLWFFLFFIEIWLMFSIFVDIFRSHDLKGSTKALWLVLVLVFPIIGIVAYLIVRGDKMRVHQVQAQAYQDRSLHDFFRHAGGGSASVADELSKLAQLKQDGVISDGEFDDLKARVMRQASGTGAS